MSKENPVIAVDMLGADKGEPGKSEHKALRGILKKGLFPEARFILVGCREEIQKALGKLASDERIIDIVDAPERINSDLKVLDRDDLKKEKEKDSSTKKCYELVQEGQADAVVSCAHTGFQAHLASSKFKRMRLKTKEGSVIRPGLSISATIPNPDEKNVTEFSDVGASLPPENPLERAQQLILKVLMALPLGVISKKRVKPDDPSPPKTFILSNATEPGKSPKEIQYAHEILTRFKAFFNYGGLREPSFFKEKDDMEVVIDDGFGGNKELKVMEDEGKGMKWAIKNLVNNSLFKWRGLGYLILRKAFKTFSPDNHAGGLIYGVNKVAVKSHGSSSSKAITVAIGKAANFVKEDVIGQVRELFEGLPKEIAEVIESTRKLAEMLGMDGEKVELTGEINNLMQGVPNKDLEEICELLKRKKEARSETYPSPPSSFSQPPRRQFEPRQRKAQE